MVVTDAPGFNGGDGNEYNNQAGAKPRNQFHSNGPPIMGGICNDVTNRLVFLDSKKQCGIRNKNAGSLVSPLADHVNA